MLGIGVQTQNAINDANALADYKRLNELGFTNADFSLNSYLKNTALYNNSLNQFFDRSISELEEYFRSHKQGAKKAGITINQMHMPYPIYIPTGKTSVNEYLWNEVAPKSMQLGAYLECKYIVIHGLKMSRYLGSEEAEWEKTSQFLDYIAPVAKEMRMTICIENLYDSIGGHLIEGPCCNVHKAVERIDSYNDRYGAEVLGFCFDTGHANLVGLDFESFIKTLDYRLKVLHIHDNDGIGDLHQIPYTFAKVRENATSTDWNGFISGLKAIKFDKVLSFETAPVLTAFPDELKDDALGMIARIGRYFADKIEDVND